MQITPIFNEAAGEAMETGPEPSNRGPKGPVQTGAEALAASAPPREDENAAESRVARLSGVFNRSAAERENPAVHTEAEEHEGAGERMDVDSAKAELDMLEAGRPEPEAERELKPPRKLARIVDSAVERQREARISALKAYIEYAEEGPDFGLDHELGNELGLAL